MNLMGSLQGLLKAQMREWRPGEQERKSRVGPVITISREPGCDGDSIAQRLANDLGLVVYDREIVEQIANNAHVSTWVVSRLDEKARSELDDWLAGLEGNRTLSSYRFLKCLREVLFAIATHGSAIILGRGGNFLLPPDKRLSLRLVAPLDVRVKNIMKELRLSEKRAREHIAKIERERRLFVRKYFKADIGDATHYHMIINTAVVTPETVVEIVKTIVKAKP